MYYGQFYLDRTLHQRFFLTKRNGFFVECGAYDGNTDSTCKFFEETMGWTGLNIEAVPFLFERLKQNRPNCINEGVALSNENKRAIFSHAVHPYLGENFGNGSLTHTKEHLNELLEKNCVFKEYDVECVRFDGLYKKHNLPEIDLFVLDVEGHEIQALDGVLTIPVLPKVFCIEHSFSTIDALTAILKDHYSYHSQEHQNVFYIKK